MKLTLPATALGLAVGCLSACDGGEATPMSEVVVSDSSSTTVVQIVGPLAGVAAPPWGLDPVFDTRGSGVEFFRIATGLIIGGDRVLVGDAGNAEVLLLDSDGNLLERLGREGDGPGEFRAITSMHELEDGRFGVYDTRLGRWTYFDSAGVITSTEPMSPPNRVLDLSPLAVGDSGRVLAIYGEMRRFALDGIRRDTTPLLRYRTMMSNPDTVGAWAAGEWAYSAVGGGAARTHVGFGRSLASFGRSGFAVLGDTDRLHVSLYRADGSEVLRILGGGESIPTTEADRQRWREMTTEGWSAETRESFRERFGQLPYRDSYPAFDALAVDREGRVWIGTTATLGATERSWIVFDHVGAALGRVEIPSDADILDIAHGLVLLRQADPLGVQRVTLHSLVEAQ